MKKILHETLGSLVKWKMPVSQEECQECHKSFPKFESLKRHVAGSHPYGLKGKDASWVKYCDKYHLDPFKCPKCTETFNTGKALRSHKSRKHKRTQPVEEEAPPADLQQLKTYFDSRLNLFASHFDQKVESLEKRLPILNESAQAFQQDETEEIAPEQVWEEAMDEEELTKNEEEPAPPSSPQPSTISKIVNTFFSPFRSKENLDIWKKKCIAAAKKKYGTHKVFVNGNILDQLEGCKGTVFEENQAFVEQFVLDPKRYKKHLKIFIQDPIKKSLIDMI